MEEHRNLSVQYIRHMYMYVYRSFSDTFHDEPTHCAEKLRIYFSQLSCGSQRFSKDIINYNTINILTWQGAKAVTKCIQ